MLGTVLHFDQTRGILRGDDQQRYYFQTADWLNDTPPHTGQRVDFVPDGQNAREIVLEEPIPATVTEPPLMRLVTPGHPSAQEVPETASHSFPARLTVNGKTLRFIVDSGIVEKVAKRVETHLNAHASGGGGTQTGYSTTFNATRLSVSSTNTTVTEIWMRDGDRELDHTLHADLSVREGQRISV